MPNSNAFVKDVTVSGGDPNVHQTAPSWVLTFIRWAERDTLRTNPTDGTTYATIRAPLIVESDCIQVSTTMNKGTLTASMSATLLMTDINYLTAVAPGDFVFVNMLNWPEDARRVVEQAHNYEPINGIDDGFKGLYKVQSVRQIISVDPTSGVKTVAFRITGFAFTEFNNTIYFNPNMIDISEQENVALFSANMGAAWARLVQNKGLTNVQDINRALIDILIGTGVAKSGAQDKNGVIRTPNTLYIIPDQVGRLLGVTNARAAKDIFVYIFGIQTYAGGTATDLAVGLNPANLTTTDNRMYQTDAKVVGEAIQKAEYWDQVKLWSILNQFSNAPLNELFTTFRVSPDGSVMPTVIFRQIPFTNDSFDAGGIRVTRFMNLPRWRIDPALIQSKDIGRDEAARVNFVQIFGKSFFGPDGLVASAETAQRNYLYDSDDVLRSGLRPFVSSGTFDNITDNNKQYHAPEWARIIGDSLIGGHLKMNGTINCMGIQDPIAVGDNLEDNGVVYHIEQISHVCTISPDGRNMFRTSISISSGISVESDASGVAYAEMDFGNAYAYRDDDAANDGILPGISESQNTVGRGKNLDSNSRLDKSFVQPNTTTSVRRSTRRG